MEELLTALQVDGVDALQVPNCVVVEVVDIVLELLAVEGAESVELLDMTCKIYVMSRFEVRRALFWEKIEQVLCIRECEDS